MKFVHVLLLFLLFPMLPARPAVAPANQSQTTDSIEAVNGSCVSLVLHDFYSVWAHQSQPSISPCSSKNKPPGVFWLGSSTNISKEQLINNNKLRIGVPIKKGFYELMKVDYYPTGKLVVKATVMLLQVVGDTAITANRSDYVDFTYPYMNAGVSMIVPTQGDGTMSPWWFMEPLTVDLWLTTLAFVLLKGVLVWIFEHEKNPEFQGSPSKIIGKVLSFSFSTFVSAAQEKLESNYSRFTVNLWTFLVFILVTAYAANLTSMLTVDKLQPAITDIKSMIRNGDYVGYQNGSFVFMLLKKLGFNESKLRPYATVEEYKDALNRGSNNGGVSAIVDEIPYIKVFLRTHCREYTMAGRTYRTGGFGFVFPRGSAMVPDISRAIMNFSEGDKMFSIEKKWFGDQTECPDPGTPIANKSLHLFSLRIIYIITRAGSAIALSIYFICFLCKCKRSEVVKDTLQGDGALVNILPMNKHFNHMNTTMNSSRVTPGPKETICYAQHEPPSQIFAIKFISNQSNGENWHVSGQRGDEGGRCSDPVVNLVPTPSKKRRYKSSSSKSSPCVV